MASNILATARGSNSSSVFTWIPRREGERGGGGGGKGGRKGEGRERGGKGREKGGRGGDGEKHYVG